VLHGLRRTEGHSEGQSGTTPHKEGKRSLSVLHIHSGGGLIVENAAHISLAALQEPQKQAPTDYADQSRRFRRSDDLKRGGLNK